MLHNIDKLLFCQRKSMGCISHAFKAIVGRNQGLVGGRKQIDDATEQSGLQTLTISLSCNCGFSKWCIASLETTISKRIILIGEGRRHHLLRTRILTKTSLDCFLFRFLQHLAPSCRWQQLLLHAAQ